MRAPLLQACVVFYGLLHTCRPNLTPTTTVKMNFVNCSPALRLNVPSAVLRIQQHAAHRKQVRQLAETTMMCQPLQQRTAKLKLHPRPRNRVETHASNLLVCEDNTCSCADVHALERRVDRLEHLIQEILSELTTCDDMLLLEREGAKCFIAKEDLIQERPARLLRAQLLDIMRRHVV